MFASKGAAAWNSPSARPKPRLSELIAAAQRGERVVITKRGEPAVELVACPKREAARRSSTSISWTADCKRLGIEQMPPDEARKLLAEFDDPAFSREVLGLGDDYEPYCVPGRE